MANELTTGKRLNKKNIESNITPKVNFLRLWREKLVLVLIPRIYFQTLCENLAA